MTPSPTPLAAVILGTVRIATVIAVALVALVLLGVTIGLEPLAVPLLMLGWLLVIAICTASVRVDNGPTIGVGTTAVRGGKARP